MSQKKIYDIFIESNFIKDKKIKKKIKIKFDDPNIGSMVIVNVGSKKRVPISGINTE
jgi:hypothetical protein